MKALSEENTPRQNVMGCEDYWKFKQLPVADQIEILWDMIVELQKINMARNVYEEALAKGTEKAIITAKEASTRFLEDT